MDAERLADTLRKTGQDHGLVGFGVCTVDPFDEVRFEMDRRIDLGLAGRRRFTYTDPEVATAVGRSFPWAERLVVASVTYLPAAGSPGPAAANTGRIARFATIDHYRPLRLGLAAVAEQLEAIGYRAEVLADDNRLVDRAAAVRAGVAWWGKSTMALAPGFGPWLLLGSVVTDAVLPVSPPMIRDCGTCVACIPACPTGALDEEGVLDATRCISYWAQTPGFIPHAIREAWGDRLYGCDDCLEACPPGSRLAEGAASTAGRVDLVDILERTDKELMAIYAHFYVPRRDARFLRRNALVALGHSGTGRAVPILTRYLESGTPVLRGHAAWSLARIGGDAARAALQHALSIETDPAVLEELKAVGREGGSR
jgi:epoxyqueuosine reductase